MIRRIRHSISTGVRVGKSMLAEDRLPYIFATFVFGMFLGSMASSKFFVELFPAEWYGRLLLDLAFLVLLLFFSTSYLGVFLVPFTVAARGFVLSALFSSLCFFSESGGVWRAFLSEIVPSFFYLPCFAVIADECISLSAGLRRRSFCGTREKRGSIIKVLIFSIPLLLAEFFFCSYLLPFII